MLDSISSAYKRKQQLLMSLEACSFAKVALPKKNDETVSDVVYVANMREQITDIISKSVGLNDQYQNSCSPPYARRFLKEFIHNILYFYLTLYHTSF